MATGILLGLVVGRRRWVERLPTLAAPLRRAQWVALAIALAAGDDLWLGRGGADPAGAPVTAFAATLARTVGRAATMAFYALAVLRLLERRRLARLLRPLALAGRMPLSNYLLQTVMASFVFFAWGLGLWGRAGPLAEALLALALFCFVQLPLSAAWLARFRYGPVESVWRRLTYGRLVPVPARSGSPNSSASNA